MDISKGNQILDGSRIAVTSTEAMRELTENEVVQVSGGTSNKPPQIVPLTGNKPPQTRNHIVPLESNHPPQ
jgi:hypothetical protein